MSEKKKKISFTKEQILESKKWANRRDVLSILLEDDKEYSSEEIEKVLEDFMKKAVK